MKKTDIIIEQEMELQILRKQVETLRTALKEIHSDSMVDSWQCKLSEKVLDETKE